MNRSARTPRICSTISPAIPPRLHFRKLLVAPVSLRQRLEDLIRREIDRAQKGEPGHLIFKMNALEDPEMIKLLYRASQAGIRVDLLVRGLCCLRPGVPGVSDNIRVSSVIGRFLEHCPNLLLPQRRPRTGLHRQRGLNAAQSESPGGNRISGGETPSWCSGSRTRSSKSIWRTT